MSDTLGPIIFDLQGLDITQEEQDILKHPLIGGVIFFARNYSSPQQISDLIKKLRAIKQTPLLICVDQEGGRVQRFRDGFTRLPSMSEIGEIFHRSHEEGLQFANLCGYVMAAELLQVGVDLSFAPVFDLRKVDNPAINDRAFDRDPSIVSALATAFIHGMQDAGMAACGKHFPGHGSVKVDSHLAMPEDNRELNAILADDLIPFATVPCASIMASHILFPKVDSNPVGFSKKWLQTILREQLEFKGLVFSDDLSMQGAVGVGDCPARASQALTAGCDMILICNSRHDVIKTLETLPLSTVNSQKFTALQGNFAGQSAQLNEKRHLMKKFLLKREQC